MLINRHNLAVAEFAGSTSSPHVQVSKTGTVATNSHYLVAVSLPSEDIEGFPVIPGFKPSDTVTPFLLSIGDCTKIKTSIPKKTKIPVLANACIGQQGNDVTVAVTDLDTPLVFRPKVPEGYFPNVAAVMPKDKPALEVYFDAAYMAKLCASAAKFSGSDTPCVTLKIYGVGSAMQLDTTNSYTGQTWTALLMPMRKPA